MTDSEYSAEYSAESAEFYNTEDSNKQIYWMRKTINMLFVV